MDYKQLSAVATLSISFFTLALFTACTPGYKNNPDAKNENIIGVPLADSSSLQSTDEKDSANIAIFDKTIKKIHLFDLENMQRVNKYEVKYPTWEHYLIYHDKLNYIIDLTKKSSTLISTKNNTKIENPLRLLTEPKSAAFALDKGYFVIYDSSNNIGVIKISKDGTVDQEPIYNGSLTNENLSIQSGELLSNGQLVLAFKNSSTNKYFIAVSNLDEEFAGLSSNNNYKLDFKLNEIQTTDIVWIAAIRNNSDLVLIKSYNTILLYNIITNQIIDSKDTSDFIVEKYSKTKDSHLIMISKSTYEDSSISNFLKSERKLYYVENSEIKIKTLNNLNQNAITSTHLDLQKNSLSFTTSPKRNYYSYGDYNTNPADRIFNKFRFSDLMLVQSLTIKNEAQVSISEKYIFSLFPSELGFATKTDIQSEKEDKIELFNMSDI